MSNNNQIILIVTILIINFIIAIGYLIWGIVTANKDKKEKTTDSNENLADLINKDTIQNEEKKEREEIKLEDEGKEIPKEDTPEVTEEKFAKDDTFYHDSICKYVILSIFMLLCPVIGFSFLLLGTLLYKIFFDSSIDLAAITFSKKRVNVIERPNVDEEINLVPLEEAIMIDDKENLRQLLLTVLRGDVSKSINAVSKALNSSDSESSHYAASAIMDINAEFQNNIQKFQAQLEKAPDDKDVNQLFIEYLIQMTSAGFLSDLELKTQVFLLLNTCENLYEHHREYLKIDYYSNLINLLTKIAEWQNAEKWINRIKEDYDDDLETYRCVLHFYFETKEKDKFFDYMNKLKNSNITIDKGLLELIRVFN